MSVDFGKWKNTFSQAEWAHINKEVARALGERPNSVMCRICRDSDGRGIVINIETQGSSGHAPLIHLFEGDWQKKGLVGRCVREAVADADDPGRVERSLCKPLN
jgi:hypothetical protein